MSGANFNVCEAGRVLVNPGSVSLDQLQHLVLERNRIGSTDPVFVRFSDYVGLMENFIRVSALKKIANDEAAHYRELLVMQEKDSSPASLIQLASLEQSFSEMLTASRTVQQCLHSLPLSDEVKACQEANGQLVVLMESICPVQDLVAEMENLSTSDAM